MCLVIEGGGNSETVCIAGLAPVQLTSPTQFGYPAGSTFTLLDGVISTSNTSMVIRRARAASFDHLALCRL
eukprot:1736346-Pyramimonas_sp.AAC.1